MPNHVTNVIEAPAEVLESILVRRTDEEIAKIKANNAEIRQRSIERGWGDPGETEVSDWKVDFAKLVPEPDNIEQGMCSGIHPEGVICWYEWNTSNWGTKWNGYELERPSDTEIQFDTAWSHPFPIIETLSKKFPDVRIKVKYADEDLSYNLGYYGIKDGKVRHVKRFEEGSDEARDWACQLKYGYTYAEWTEDDEDEDVQH